ASPCGAFRNEHIVPPLGCDNEITQANERSVLQETIHEDIPAKHDSLTCPGGLQRVRIMIESQGRLRNMRLDASAREPVAPRIPGSFGNVVRNQLRICVVEVRN